MKATPFQLDHKTENPKILKAVTQTTTITHRTRSVLMGMQK
jgi:hypothetical protein